MILFSSNQTAYQRINYTESMQSQQSIKFCQGKSAPCSMYVHIYYSSMLHTHETNKYSMGTCFYGVCHLHILHFRLTFCMLASRICGFLYVHYITGTFKAWTLKCKFFFNRYFSEFWQQINITKKRQCLGAPPRVSSSKLD